MVPFLCDSLREILTSFLQMFILNDTIMKADMTLKLLKIETDDIDLHKPYESVQIRTATKLHVTNYEKVHCSKKTFFESFIKKYVYFFLH